MCLKSHRELSGTRMWVVITGMGKRKIDKYLGDLCGTF